MSKFAKATHRRGAVVAFAVSGTVAALVAATTLGASASDATRVAAPKLAVATPKVAGPAGRIKHVIVIYQENHSFDETLGDFCRLHNHRCDGYVGRVTLKGGNKYAMIKSPDPVPGVWHNVAAQTWAVDGGKMDGWAKVPGCRPPSKKRWCLSYYTPQQIPNLTTLAAKFVVSDRTFSMYKSPSWGGHIYAVAATQDNFTGDIPRSTPGLKRKRGWGCDSNLQSQWINPATKILTEQPSCIPAKPGTLDPKKYPYNGAYRRTPVQWVPTIFDRLDAKHLSWKLYSSTSVWSICPSFAECEFGPQHQNITNPKVILSDAVGNTLPAFSILLPDGGGGTSQHNGASMRAGDNWIGQVLSTLENSPSWSSTAVFITYDDCGCFYDHVPPGTNPDGSKQGVRVPMVIVSPYAKKAYTDHHPATFASILHFTEKTFGLRPLSKNDKLAYGYSASFNFARPPSGPRGVLQQHPVSAASKRYIAAHPPDPDDPT